MRKELFLIFGILIFLGLLISSSNALATYHCYSFGACEWDDPSYITPGTCNQQSICPDYCWGGWDNCYHDKTGSCYEYISHHESTCSCEYSSLDTTKENCGHKLIGSTCYYNGSDVCTSSGWDCDWGNYCNVRDCCNCTDTGCVQDHSQCSGDCLSTCYCEEIDCSPCDNTRNNDCPLCPEDGCQVNNYYDYPEYNSTTRLHGKCTIISCDCDTGTGSGQPCQPSISYNDSRCVGCSDYTVGSHCIDAGCCWCDYPAPLHCQNCPCGEAPAPPPGTAVFQVKAPSTNSQWVSHNITVAPDETFYLDIMLGCPWVQGTACAEEFQIYDYTAEKWYWVSTYTGCCTNYCDKGCLSISFSTEGQYYFQGDVFLYSSCHCSVASGSCLGCSSNYACNTPDYCDEHAGCPEHICTEPGVLCITVEEPILTPTVTTNEATNVEGINAILNGYLDNDGGDYCVAGFDVGDTIDYTKMIACGYKTTGQSFSEYYLPLNSLTKGKCYHFRARAENSNATGYGSDEKFITKPDVLSNFAATAIGGTQINLIWTKGDGAYYTMIKRKADSWPNSDPDSATDRIYSDTDSNFSDTGLTPGTTYYYRAWSQAYEEDCYAWSDDYVEDFVITNQKPSASSLNSSPGCIWPLISLTWEFVDLDAGDGMSAYQIEIWDHSDFSGNKLMDSGKISTNPYDYPTGTSFTYEVGNLPISSAGYYWQVKVWDSLGAESVWGDGQDTGIKLLYDEPKEQKNLLARLSFLKENFGGLAAIIEAFQQVFKTRP